MSNEPETFRILISIGGGPDAYASLRFAARLNDRFCADITLLFVRPPDSGLTSGGLEMRVARENMLGWGLELPGLRHLKAARDILLELGQIHEGSGDAWQYHQLSGDEAGEWVREYRNPCGGSITLRLCAAPDVTTAVVHQAKAFKANVIIVGGTPPQTGLKKWLKSTPLSLQIAAHAGCSVIVARNMEPGKGLLVCLEDTETSRTALPKAIRCASTCEGSVTLLSVAEDEEGEQAARRAVDQAAEAFRQAGIEPEKLMVEIGDPVDTITRMGPDYSLIVLGESDKPWFTKRFSVAHEVAARAVSSVLILK
ncbi:universal stress protein [Pseudodesulfovibrio sp.]|uniref:universal stress protein n=1 Tax=unclassified Pseudodesulfovibrio TaxID=2661612 RepID=UPI003B004414